MAEGLKKRKATWIGFNLRFIKQLFVSLTSFITFPFVKFKTNAVLSYYNRIYNSDYHDPLLFDGKDFKYLQQFEILTKDFDFGNLDLLDVGCGNGSLYKFLRSKNELPNSYLGIDLAHKNLRFSNSSCIIQMNITDLSPKIISDYNTITFLNSVCYLSDDVLSNFLAKIKGEKRIIIIDPIPSIFWDAHFSGIKLYYRTDTLMIKMLNNNGFSFEKGSVDFRFNFFGKFHFPLSYCLVFSN